MGERKYRPRSERSAFFVLRGIGDYLVDLGLADTNPVRQLVMP